MARMKKPRSKKSRIRREIKPKPNREFVVGERILATWSDGKKYPARVTSVYGNDMYHVLFDDGYVEVVKASKMTKVVGSMEKYLETNDYIGSKQERRDKKRKHSVKELFSTQAQKKARLEAEKMKQEETTKVEKTVVKVEQEQKSSVLNAVTENVMPFDDPNLPTLISHSKRGVGTSIIVPDKKLPPGWQKHFIQRKTGSSAGKWDVFFIHENSPKKFRSKNELKAYFHSIGQRNFDLDLFDFCIRQKKKSDTKIKTLVPRIEPLNPYPNTPTSGLTTAMSPAENNEVFIGSLRVEMEDGAYKCPKKGCNKIFRKGLGLQMHIGHYHTEYSQYLGSTPSVAEVAHFRATGETIQNEVTPKRSTTSGYCDRVHRMDRRREKSTSAPILSPMHNNTTTSPVADRSPMPPLLKAEVAKDKDAFLDSDARHGDEDEPAFQPGSISPGTAFHRKTLEEKGYSGIKTLFPVRPGEKSKQVENSKKNDQDVAKSKKSQGVTQDHSDIGDLDESTLDTDKSSFSYRFSRTKSDVKNDDNRESSQLNESRYDKEISLKGEDIKTDSDVQENGMTMMINGELVKLERLRREEIINCTCGIMEEDGLMIQCDVCLCWQHAYCYGVESESDVPDKYICYTCRYPLRQRLSKQFSHDQEWIKEGKLPSIPGRCINQAKVNQRTAMLKRSYDLVSALLKLQEVLHSLRVKINVAEKKDHPKLYLWAKNWEKVVIQYPDSKPVPVLKYKMSPTSELLSKHALLENGEEQRDENIVDSKTITSDMELRKILEEDDSQPAKSDVVNEDNSTSKHDMKNKYESSGKSESVPNTDTPFAQTPTADAEVPKQPFVPEPEAPIDSTECRARLLEHIDHFHDHILVRLMAIETQVTYLEKMDPDTSPEPDLSLRSKQTVQMLLRDLATVRKLADLF